MFVVLALIAGVDRSTAAAVSLAWSPSPDTSVIGYKVYYGTTSGVYTTNVVAGNATNATVNGLTSGTTYYFAATSYDASGNESGYSTEVSSTVTNLATVSGNTAATLTPQASSARGQFSFTVSGTSGAQYVVQASTDLVHWTTLQTNIPPFTFMDTNAGAFARRFYRASSLQ